MENKVLSLIASFIALAFVIMSYFMKNKSLYLVCQAICIIFLIASYFFTVQFFAMIGLGVGLMRTVTFFMFEKNGKKAKEAAIATPMDRLLIETDSPYLSPEPHRGERNDSAKVRFVAKTIAELKGITEEELAKITLENGKRFFGIE